MCGWRILHSQAGIPLWLFIIWIMFQPLTTVIHSTFFQWSDRGPCFYKQAGCWMPPSCQKRLWKFPCLPVDPLEKIKPRWVSLAVLIPSNLIGLSVPNEVVRFVFAFLGLSKRQWYRQHRARVKNNAETVRSLYIEGYCVGILIELWTLLFLFRATSV